jgi:hypothetical protein
MPGTTYNRYRYESLHNYDYEAFCTYTLKNATGYTMNVIDPKNS